jgi:hypothetical protein
MLSTMTNQSMTRQQTAEVFADPVAYLADLGLAAVLVSVTTLAEAA